MKDPYIFDFLTLEEPFHERELETGLVRHLEKFLLELGQGFAFVGRAGTVRISAKGPEKSGPFLIGPTLKNQRANRESYGLSR